MVEEVLAPLFFSVLNEILSYGFRIHKNGAVECYARGDGDPSSATNQEANASCSVVVELAQGDSVNVYSMYANQEEAGWHHFCSFSGFLIRAYD